MMEPLPKATIKDRWRLDGIIGSGGFGLVYIATDLETDQLVAVKLQEFAKTSPPASNRQAVAVKPPKLDGLQRESLYYTLLSKHPGIATLHDNGLHSPDFEFMVCDLLGASLQNLFDRCGRRFSLKTTLMLADQLISRLETFHSRNLLHRDVKPDNFAMGFGKEDGETVYILDFGMVSNFAPNDNYATEHYDFCGTFEWASIATHMCRPQSPKDDLESLAYMLIYFIRGSLPWQTVRNQGERSATLNKHVTKLKLSLPIDIICQDAPSEFARHLKYVRSLKHNDKPNYAKLRDMYRRLMKRMGYQYDGVYDWDVNEMKQQTDNAVPAPVQKQDILAAENEKKEGEEDNQQNKPPVAKITKKRKITLTEKEDNKDHPPKRQRVKPAAVEKKKVNAKNAKKAVAKKAPAKKPVVRKKVAK
ncbi:hypothetical protein ACHAQJ_010222 [Trichoderma viride]